MIQESKIMFDRIVYWSDSLATLHLIRNTTRRFGVFVDARLAEIPVRSSSCISDCHYCPTTQNSADAGTRVIAPKNTKKIMPWVDGLTFLRLPECEWPIII